MLVKVEGVESVADVRFKVPQNSVDPAKLRKIVRVAANSVDRLVAASYRGDRAKAGQAIGENGTAGSQVISGPSGDSLGTEASHRSDFGVGSVSGLLTETTATIGIMFSDPRTALPPGRSPPRYASSIWIFPRSI